MSGQWLYDELREKYHLQCEMAAGDYCLAMFTIADGDEAYVRMKQALTEIDAKLSAEYAAEETAGAFPQECRCMDEKNMEVPACRYPLYLAWDMPYRLEKLTDAAGCTAGEFVNLYPPGIPMLVPGEMISDDICRRILENCARKLNVQGLTEKAGEYYIKILEQ